jgi:hypothetical protein
MKAQKTEKHLAKRYIEGKRITAFKKKIYSYVYSTISAVRGCQIFTAGKSQNGIIYSPLSCFQ